MKQKLYSAECLKVHKRSQTSLIDLDLYHRYLFLQTIDQMQKANNYMQSTLISLTIILKTIVSSKRSFVFNTLGRVIVYLHIITCTFVNLRLLTLGPRTRLEKPSQYVRRACGTIYQNTYVTHLL
jgi:hypothetical protein